MKISVVVPAHNETGLIGACLDSLAAQTRKADEIIVVLHNCTDGTAAVVRKHDGITVRELTGPEGVIYARKDGLDHASGDIIASIDGDSVADPRWLERISAPLLGDPSVAATGGYVRLTGSLRALEMSIVFFYLQKLWDPGYQFYFWGANFACRRTDYFLTDRFVHLPEVKKFLGLTYWSDDLYLSMQLKKVGRVVFVPGAKVWSPMSAEPSPGKPPFFGSLRNSDRLKLFKYFKEK